MLKDLSEIYERKGSDVAVFLGCGSSLNALTKAEWRKIASFDTWVSNYFIYHRFVPRFYHLELKSSKLDWNEIWKRRKESKGRKYDDVNFVVMRGRKYLTNAIGEHEHVYCYERIKGRCDSRAPIHPTIVTHNCNASFTLVLELLHRFDYKKVLLFGVDLRDSRYFWTGRSEYGEVHDQTNAGRMPDDVHTTARRVVNFAVGFNKYKMRGRLFVGYRDTLLYRKKGLKYLDIMNL